MRVSEKRLPRSVVQEQDQQQHCDENYSRYLDDPHDLPAFLSLFAANRLGDAEEGKQSDGKDVISDDDAAAFHKHIIQRNKKPKSGEYEVHAVATPFG